MYILTYKIKNVTILRQIYLIIFNYKNNSNYNLCFKIIENQLNTINIKNILAILIFYKNYRLFSSHASSWLIAMIPASELYNLVLVEIRLHFISAILYKSIPRKTSIALSLG